MMKVYIIQDSMGRIVQVKDNEEDAISLAKFMRRDKRNIYRVKEHDLVYGSSLAVYTGKTVFDTREWVKDKRL